MRLFPVVCLTVLLVTAGCMASPFDDSTDQERPVTLVLNNSANVTQTFEVSVVDADASVTVRLNDSRTVNDTIGQGLVTTSSGDDYFYTEIELPESARLHGRYTLEPGEVKRTSIEDFPQDAAVVVVLHRADKIGWWATAYCSDGALVVFSATSRPSKFGDAWAGYRCHNSFL